jgi:5-methylcytosine-specific restriction endonuclease McrA
MSGTERQALRARDRAWAAAHPDRIQAKNRRLYQQNPEKYAAQRDRWRVENLDRHRHIARLAQARRRTAKKSNSNLSVSTRDWEKLVTRANGHCAYCNERAPLTMDHVIPLSRGGRHAIGNLQPVCEQCNKRKGAMLLSEWRYRRALEAGVRGRVPVARLAGR